MATLPSNTFTLLDGTTTLGDGAGTIGSGTTGGADTFLGKANLPYGGYVAVGETWYMTGTALGGNDRFVGAVNVGQAADGFDDLLWGFGGEDGGAVFFGDAMVLGEDATGGNDLATGGANGASTFFGDGEDMYDNASGGMDSLKGGHATTSTVADAESSNLLVGDAWYASSYGEDGVTGGDDVLSGGNATTTASGGTAGYAANINAAFGDFVDMYGATGGDDSLVGGNASARGGGAVAVNWLVGDGEDMYGSMGGDDTVRGGGGTLSGNGEAYAFNLMAGDAMYMSEGSTGGNDQLFGGGFADGATGIGDGYVLNLMAGDAWDIYAEYGPVTMGNDTLTGGSATGGTDGYVTNVIYGDVGDYYAADEFLWEFSGEDEQPEFNSLEIESPSGGAINGDDSITGGTGRVENYLVGDSEYMDSGWTEVGGNDTLTAGGAGSYNFMVGDGYYMGSNASGGDDVLIGGAGEDYMIGDGWSMYGEDPGGADTFVFRFGNGQDEIEDFRVEDGDRIDITAMRTVIGSFAALEAQGRIEDDGSGNTILHLDRTNPMSDSNTVMLYGVDASTLTADQFLF